MTCYEPLAKVRGEVFTQRALQCAGGPRREGGRSQYEGVNTARCSQQARRVRLHFFVDIFPLPTSLLGLDVGEAGGLDRKRAAAYASIDGSDSLIVLRNALDYSSK